ncbi:MAG: HIRAN domain-containing protein [Clostridia bacterium]|nr:HIRAN domain-containing protein [Clostridia bacterium]
MKKIMSIILVCACAALVAACAVTQTDSAASEQSASAQSSQQEVGAAENSKEGLPDEIALTGTQYSGRTDRIEKIKVGDTVALVREPSSEWGENTIDVRTPDGSIGYLDQDACDILAPLIDAGKIKCTAAVARAVPLSERSRHCKTAIVTVSVKASYQAAQVDAVGLHGDDMPEKIL